MAETLDGKWLDERLAEVGSNRAGLSRALDRDRSVVTKLVQGKRQLKVREIDIIAAHLKCSKAAVAKWAKTPMTAAKVEGFGEMQQSGYEAAEQSSPKVTRIHPLFGSMKGTTIVMPGVDLTEPADPELLRIYDDDYDPQQLEVDRIKSDVGLSSVGKVWALDELGLGPAEIAAALEVARKQVDAALAIRRKVRGW